MTLHHMARKSFRKIVSMQWTDVEDVTILLPCLYSVSEKKAEAIKTSVP